MQLGTGIFLSALLFVILGFYVATKDRLNWKKIIMWSGKIMSGLALIGALFFYIYFEYNIKPKKMTELWSISLNDSSVDVKFKKGEPDYRIGIDLWKYESCKNEDCDYYYVKFKNDKTVSIFYYGLMHNAPIIQGVNNYDTYEQLESKLGNPSCISRSEDELRRAYSFEKFNITIHLEKGVIYGLGIYDSDNSSYKVKEESEAMMNTIGRSFSFEEAFKPAQ